MILPRLLSVEEQSVFAPRTPLTLARPIGTKSRMAPSPSTYLPQGVVSTPGFSLFPTMSESVSCVRNGSMKRRRSSRTSPFMDLTHMLLLYYKSAQGSGMGWHRDSDPNDGDNDHPIVSVSLGDSCVFGYKPLLQEPQYVVVNSGDVLICGGPQRMLKHSVEKILPNTSPTHLRPFLPEGRFNFTFQQRPQHSRKGRRLWKLLLDRSQLMMLVPNDDWV